MRLSKKEIEAIKRSFAEIFGEGEIYLFGSRTDDTKKGGDIDLFLELPYTERYEDLLQKRRRFKLKLYDRLGEQKIDVLIGGLVDSEILSEIRKSWVRL
jgi:predicted nucleotidyltransferase